MNVIEVASRLYDKTSPEPNSGCFIWMGSVDASGYGRIAFNRRNWKATRVAWLLAHGDPCGLHVLHKCDNRLCVNTAHLFLGTNRDNHEDKVRKGRHHNALLSEEQVRFIRKMNGQGKGSRTISKSMMLPRHLIEGVLYRGRYAHVS